MAPKPDITFYFLQASRAIRTAWLLEELELPYKLEFSPRAPSGLAPDDFKAKVGTKIGKAPTIKDGKLIVQESAAIAEYLLETYAPDSFLLPPLSQPAARAKVREWMSAAEGAFMIHGLAIHYARWRIPEPAKSDGKTLAEMEKGLAKNVQGDLDWLESELREEDGDFREFLVGDELTVADIMMHFSVQFIFARKLGIEDKTWPAVERWLEGLEGLEGYQKAVKKTGYDLSKDKGQ